MQGYQTDENYDLIALNWCLGYVGDEDVVKVLRKFKSKLRTEEGAVTRSTDQSAFIVVLDNIKDLEVYDGKKQR